MHYLSITTVGTWWEKPFLPITLYKMNNLSNIVSNALLEVTGILLFPHLPSFLIHRGMLVLTFVSFIMHVAEYKDTIKKRLTAITRGIWEILRVKMQHISIVTLSLRVILSDSVQTEFTWMRSLRLHETAHVFIQMKWKMFTVNSGELSCTIKIKQPRQLSQEDRAEQPPEGTFLKVSRLLSQLHAKSCKSLTDPSMLWPHLLTFSLSLSSPSTLASLPFFKNSKVAPASGLGSRGPWLDYPSSTELHGSCCPRPPSDLCSPAAEDPLHAPHLAPHHSPLLLTLSCFPIGPITSWPNKYLFALFWCFQYKIPECSFSVRSLLNPQHSRNNCGPTWNPKY